MNLSKVSLYENFIYFLVDTLYESLKYFYFFFVDITSQDEVGPSSAINLDDWRCINILMLFMGEPTREPMY